jgi:hypothetical protein
MSKIKESIDSYSGQAAVQKTDLCTYTTTCVTYNNSIGTLTIRVAAEGINNKNHIVITRIGNLSSEEEIEYYRTVMVRAIPELVGALLDNGLKPQVTIDGEKYTTLGVNENGQCDYLYVAATTKEVDATPSSPSDAGAKKTLDVDLEIGKTTYEHGELMIKVDCNSNLVKHFNADATKMIIERFIEHLPGKLIGVIKPGHLPATETELPFDIKAKIRIDDISVKVGNVNIELVISDNETPIQE